MNTSVFPFTLKQLLIFLAILVTSTLVCCSCGSTKVTTQQIRAIRVDTVYLSNTQYDSIYIIKDKLTDRSKDSIFIKDVSIEYRYKLLHDTVKVVQRDSIPYQVTITEVKEITRPLTFFDHLTRAIFWIVATILFAKLIMKLKHPYSL